MEDQTPFPVADLPNEESEEHYRELVEKSVAAREAGNHWAAQKYATEAHKWAMDERIRLQRLAHAREALTAATRRLETAWDKDRECQTVAELQEKHPEFKSIISAWEKAQQFVEELESMPDPAERAEAARQSQKPSRPGRSASRQQRDDQS